MTLSAIRKRPETRSTRDAILDAADALMGRYGFRKMTMDDLAREASVSKRTIYVHFKDKEDVGLSSIGRVVDAAHARLKEIANEPGEPRGKLHRMLVERVMARVLAVQDYYHSLDELFEIVRPAYMARRQATFEREIELIGIVLEEGRSTGSFAMSDARQTATSLLLATNAFLPYSLSVRELGQPEAIRQALEAMAELLIKGLRPERD